MKIHILSSIASIYCGRHAWERSVTSPPPKFLRAKKFEMCRMCVRIYGAVR